jgi:predicted TIM-barrel fold metal-dependent hydrolase
MGDPVDIRLREYRPRSRLRNPVHVVHRAAVAAVDAHAHIGRWLTGDTWAAPDVAELIDRMDACNVSALVNFDGRWGPELDANLDRYDRRYPDRFATLCQVDWAGADDPGSGDRLAASLARSVERGARGLKVWKDLGLRIRDAAGDLILPDRPALSPVWEKAAELGVPVAIHTADPVAFFDPVDHRNERYEELSAHPEWSWAGSAYPTFQRLVDALEHLVASHPQTTFVGVHVGCFAEDLGWVGRMLDTYSNFLVDTAGRVAELGRQPRGARALITRHPDRVLFGTDQCPPYQSNYKPYFRFLETADEYFPYSPKDPPPAGRWQISGVDLPLTVLEQVYARNARRLYLPG